MGHLYGCKRLYNRLRPHFLDLTDEVQVVRKGEIWMAAPNHMNLRDGLVQPLLDFRCNLVHGQEEASLLALLSTVGAEPAAIYADVAIVNMLVVDPVGFLTVKPLSHQVSQKSNGEKIIGLKQSQPIFPGETKVGHYFVVYVSKLAFLHPPLHGGRRKTPFESFTAMDHRLTFSFA